MANPADRDGKTRKTGGISRRRPKLLAPKDSSYYRRRPLLWQQRSQQPEQRPSESFGRSSAASGIVMLITRLNPGFPRNAFKVIFNLLAADPTGVCCPHPEGG